MENLSQTVDVCVVCALPEEARAFLEIVRQQCNTVIEERSSAHYHYTYRFATIKNNKDEPLNLHISWLPRYGPQEMLLHLSHVLDEYQPCIAIMTGICAGDAQRVQLGDLIIAERTFTYDNGKFTLDKDGRQVHEPDTMTYQLDANLVQFLALFDDWQLLVARLKRPPSPYEQGKRRKIACHIKPMASGSAVRADHPFEQVQAPVRGTVAIDMEGAAFGLVMSRHPQIPWLIVKGVCDYADQNKNDLYHKYAARASALYALGFIQAYVTEARLPRPSNPTRSTTGQQSAQVDATYSMEHDDQLHQQPTATGAPRIHSFSKLAWSLTLFFLFVVGTQIYLNITYNTNSTPLALIFFNGLITLITLALALFQTFPGGMPGFLKLLIPGFTVFLQKRSIIVLLTLLFISLLFNVFNLVTIMRSMQTLKEFSIPTPNSRPVAMIAGSDGTFWFTEERGNRIGHITAQGEITEYPVPTPNAILGGLTRGIDGNLWFYENQGNKVGNITPQGQITEFPLPEGSDPVAITSGPDGNIWVVGERPNTIWRMTLAGVITGAYKIPSADPGTKTSGTETLVPAPDGNLWFVEDLVFKVGHITPQGVFSEIPISRPLSNQHDYHHLTVGPDGNLWIADEFLNQIGRVTLRGQVTEFPSQLQGGSPGSLLNGPNGNLWFTDDTNHIGQITTSGTYLDELAIPGLESRPFALTMGQDKTIWFLEPFGNKIGRITLDL